MYWDVDCGLRSCGTLRTLLGGSAAAHSSKKSKQPVAANKDNMQGILDEPEDAGLEGFSVDGVGEEEKEETPEEHATAVAGFVATPTRARPTVDTAERGLLAEAAKACVRRGGKVSPAGATWFTDKAMPSKAAIKEQLKKLRGRSNKGTFTAVTTRMATAHDKAKRGWQAFHKKQECKPATVVDYSHLIKDGRADSRWRARLDAGEAAPPPFVVGGQPGRNELFSISAVREHLRAPDRPSTATHHHKIVQRSKKAAEVTAGAGSAQKAAEGFLDSMKPTNAEGTADPEWVCKLREGEMAQGIVFWG
jgi:hypothetical protein